MAGQAKGRIFSLIRISFDDVSITIVEVLERLSCFPSEFYVKVHPTDRPTNDRPTTEPEE